jgi:hypothetical protein
MVSLACLHVAREGWAKLAHHERGNLWRAHTYGVDLNTSPPGSSRVPAPCPSLPCFVDLTEASCWPSPRLCRCRGCCAQWCWWWWWCSGPEVAVQHGWRRGALRRRVPHTSHVPRPGLLALRTEARLRVPHWRYGAAFLSFTHVSFHNLHRSIGYPKVHDSLAVPLATGGRSE